jgi:hypothetical protein
MPTAEPQNFLGPDYKYQNFIKDPGSMGITSKGTVAALSKNIVGITNYSDLLIYGDNAGAKKATTTGKILGNRFFYNTGGMCLDNANQTEKERYIYVDNVPSGKVSVGASSTGLKGLLPGLIGNLGVFSNISLMNAFTAPNKPPCQEVTLQTIDVNNQYGTDTQYIALMDIANMDPCLFPKGINPADDTKLCRNGFTNINDNGATNIDDIDVTTNIIILIVLIIGIIILYKLLLK